jgi:hypothetical protein
MNTNIYNKLIIFIMLTMMSWPGYSQDSSEATVGDKKAVELITSLGTRIGNKIQDYFVSLEALAANEALIAAIQNEDNIKLEELSTDFQTRLLDSLKVRLYIQGKEEPDSVTTPACGFACIAIVRDAYKDKPVAEALLFRSADANITLARGVHNQDGKAIGAIVAHYSFNQLKEEINKLTAGSMFIELRQRVAGPPVVLHKHGDKNIKQGAAKKIVKIPQTRWNIAVWTSGEVTIEDYIELPELPWFYIILAITVLIVGIVVLIIYRIKHPSAAKKKTIAAQTKATFDNHEQDNPTLILGGGAKGVDVSQYLKDSDITNLKKKLE